MASKRTNPLSGSFRDPPDKNKEQKAAEMAEAEKEVKALDPAPPPTPSAEQKPPERVSGALSTLHNESKST